MAEYDGSIRINTKIDTADFGKAVSDMSNETKKMADGFDNVDSKSAIALSKAQADVEKTKAKIESLKTEMERLESPKDSKTVSNLKLQVQDAEKEVRELEEALSNVDSKPISSSSLDEMKQKAEQAEQSLLDLLNQREALEESELSKLGDLGFDMKSPKTQAAAESTALASEEYQKLTDQISKAEQKLTEYEEKVQRVSEIEVAKRHEKLEQELGKANDKLSTYNDKLEIAKQYESDTNNTKYQRLQQDLRGLNAELVHNTQKLQQANTKIKEMPKTSDKASAGFDRMGGSLKKLGRMLGGVFLVKKLFDFGKQAVNVASDLDEVQNVVDTAFGSMRNKMEEFAERSIQNFGISKLAAKETGSTYMAMAKGMGVAKEEASDMAVSLTGLSADMASFYNQEQRVTATALNSVFTGETESLKKFGVVMTEANLQQFALTQGINKKISAMSQGEKVQLRYNYVMQQTSLAQGDFARTSDSWANQVKILQEQFKELLGIIGTGLISVLSPAMRSFNSFMSSLISMARKTASVLSSIFGGFNMKVGSASGSKGGGGNGGGTAKAARSVGTQSEDSVLAPQATRATAKVSGSGANVGKNSGSAHEALSDSYLIQSKTADKATASNEKLAKAIDKAKKAAKGALAGFDDLNVLQMDNDVAAAGTGGGGGGAGGADLGAGIGEIEEGIDLTGAEEDIENFNSVLNGLIDKILHLKDLFVEGFKMSWDPSKIDNIKESLGSIGKSLKEIFTDTSVSESFNNLLDTMALSAGKNIGAFTDMGMTIVQNLVGGVASHLDENKDFIKEKLINIFDATSNVMEMWANFTVGFADVFSVFGGETGQGITGDIIGIFSNAFLGITELGIRAFEELSKLIVVPFTENKDGIKEALENTLKPIKKITQSIENIVTNTFKTVSNVFDKYISPAFDKFSSGLSTIFGGILDAYNNYLAPVLDFIAEGFGRIMDDYMQPFIDSFLNLAGSIINGIATIWEYISPFVSWVLEAVIGAISNAIMGLWPVIEYIISVISSGIVVIMDVLRGLIDFFVGVFTGDWGAAWDAIVQIVQSIGDHIGRIFSAIATFLTSTIQSICNSIKTTINVIWDGIVTYLTTIWDRIKLVFAPVIDFFTSIFTKGKDGIHEAFSSIASFFSEKWQAITEVFKDTVTFFKDKFKDAVDKIKEVFKDIKDFFQEKWDDITKVFKDVASWFGRIFEESVKAIKAPFEGITKFFSDLWGDIKGIFSTPISASVNVSKTITETTKPAEATLKDYQDTYQGPINLETGFSAFATDEHGVEMPPSATHAGANTTPTLNQRTFATSNNLLSDLANIKRNETVSTPSITIESLTTALENVFAGKGGDLILELEGSEFGRIIKPFLDIEANRIGVKLVKGV